MAGDSDYPNGRGKRDDRFVMPNGKWEGTLITRVPVDYLKWMVNVGHTYEENAERELARRGTVTPTLDVSGHAIDRASQRLLKKWLASREGSEGLHAWLVRVAEAAWKEGGPAEKIDYAGIGFVFEVQGKWPVLKTVAPRRRSGRQTSRPIETKRTKTNKGDRQ